MSRHDNYLDSRWSRRPRVGSHTRPHCDYHRLHNPWPIRLGWAVIVASLIATVVITVLEHSTQ